MLMAQFPGFIQLQAGLLDEKLGLDRHETWQRLADDDLKSVESHSWWHNVQLQLQDGRMGRAGAEACSTVRSRCGPGSTHSAITMLAPFMDKLLLVTGHARFTPDGFEETPDGLVYLNAPDDGDGRVTRQSALLPGIRTWTLDCDHGSLPEQEGGVPRVS